MYEEGAMFHEWQRNKGQGKQLERAIMIRPRVWNHSNVEFF